ncbi:MAG: TIGR04076 family protein [Desulfobacterales bacterium]|nr:TIGR04076 family protein [Desulfobacterales bacterium]
MDPALSRLIQDHLGYSDEEISLFEKNPRNQEVMDKAPELMNQTIIAEVVHSHGCNSRHRVGDRFYFDGAGNLLTTRGPKRICVYALKAFASAVHAGNELFYAGADPNGMRFKRVACHDVGIRCGGWGQIVLEFSMKDRKMKTPPES